jgi:hypothetical protein
LPEEPVGRKDLPATRCSLPLYGKEATPSCCVMPGASKTIHASEILPSRTRQILRVVKSMRLPIGGMLIGAPWCVTRTVQRLITFFPEDISSLRLTVCSTPLPSASVDSGRAQKVEYLACSSKTPGGLEDGQK